MTKKVSNLCSRLSALCVFRELLNTPLLRAFAEIGKTTERVDAYSRFVAEIYRGGGNLTDCVRKLVFEDENVYVTSLAAGCKIDPCIVASVTRELNTLSELAALGSEDFSELLGEIAVAGFSSKRADLAAEYAARASEIHKHGYGIFASHGMFRLSDTVEHRIEPIVSADKTEIEAFTGYEEQRQLVIANTQAFVDGKPAANVLLYGDAGTGKSSTVKAVANRFYSEGVRLIELRKDQMSLLPFVMEKINRNPLKFIIFIDDLSFNRNDDTFSMLKAALEGSASAKASNAVIYATSNRRHIVRECFDDREGSDVHRNDTMQELLSLSARFGLSVRFEKPNKALYLEIVRELARKKGIAKETSQLEIEAEAFALAKGHRSPRCAEQYINSLL
ncbi:MAG: DUF815 domain-containing protein [Clostridia bacterium]|nr:DUF815 domain-containing protein [Clostridia bacterium]